MRKATLLLFALSFTVLVKAQETATFNFTLNHVGLFVNDVQQIFTKKF